MQRFQTSDISIRNGNLNEIPHQKIHFRSTLPFKLIHVTVANADIESLKSFHIFLKRYAHAGEIWKKNRFSVKNLKISCSLNNTILFKHGKNIFKECMERL